MHVQGTRSASESSISIVVRYHPHPKFLPYPAKYISIRGAEDDKYTLVDITKDVPKILEEIEFSRALFEVYEGGVVWSSLLIPARQRRSHMPRSLCIKD